MTAIFMILYKRNDERLWNYRNKIKQKWPKWNPPKQILNTNSMPSIVLLRSVHLHATVLIRNKHIYISSFSFFVCDLSRPWLPEEKFMHRIKSVPFSPISLLFANNKGEQLDGKLVSLGVSLPCSNAHNRCTMYVHCELVVVALQLVRVGTAATTTTTHFSSHLSLSALLLLFPLCHFHSVVGECRSVFFPISVGLVARSRSYALLSWFSFRE